MLLEPSEEFVLLGLGERGGGLSATADREWPKTVDYVDAPQIELIDLGAVDQNGQLKGVYKAAKPIERLDTLDRTNIERLFDYRVSYRRILRCRRVCWREC